MKYYLDEDISPKVAAILKKQQIDVVSTHDVNMIQASDRAQLEYAASAGRVVVTRNRNDFIQLTVQFFNDLRPHFGVLIVPYSIPGDNFRILADALNKYALLHASGMEPYTIDFLQK
jgi:predicted nuclease of predicted toxin-antitoxin system